MRLARSAVTALTILACSACIPDYYAFKVDDRVSITAPSDNSKVTLPVRLRWRVKDFDVVEPGTAVRKGAGYFAVFVDRAPMPPGKDLKWVVRNATDCTAAGCPDAKYLATQDIYITTDTQLLLTDLDEGRKDRRERHTATIILVDGSGARIGESAFDVDFEVRRGEQS